MPFGITAMHSFPSKTIGKQRTMKVMIRKHYIDHRKHYRWSLLFERVKTNSLVLVVYPIVIWETKVDPFSSFQLDSKNGELQDQY